MSQRQLGPFSVSAIGLGCMNLSHAYGQPPSPEAVPAIAPGAAAPSPAGAVPKLPAFDAVPQS